MHWKGGVPPPLQGQVADHEGGGCTEHNIRFTCLSRRQQWWTSGLMDPERPPEHSNDALRPADAQYGARVPTQGQTQNPLQGTQPTPCDCFSDGNCLLQWHLYRQSPPPTACPTASGITSEALRKWSVRFNQATFGRIGSCGHCCMPRLGRVAEAKPGQGGGTPPLLMHPWRGGNASSKLCRYFPSTHQTHTRWCSTSATVWPNECWFLPTEGAYRALCEKLAVLHHREFGKFRRLKGRH